MDLKDLLLTPIYLIIFYAIAYGVRSKYTNKYTRKYFIPALTLKFIGAIGLGLIYQFYYGNGTSVGSDTGNYYWHSKVVISAFHNSFSDGIRLFFGNTKMIPDLMQYITRMEWYRAPTEYFVVQTATFFGLLGFGSYAVIALLFAFSSFTGMWALYTTFLKLYPNLYKEFAIAVFFLPSVFFWGSGLMKDSLTIGALGWLMYAFYTVFIEKKTIIKSAIILMISAYVIYSVKVYILLSFLPPALYWVFIENNNRIKNKALRNILKPAFILIGVGVAFVGATTLTAGDERYDLEKIGERTKINNQYLSVQVASGSAYNIGELDGSISSMITIAPQAIVVALYRPFIWEVRNPIMLLSALEAMLFIYLTAKFIAKVGLFKTVRLITAKPILTFCMAFSLVFAFGVGTNSGNFGTLVRYKIPLMPFYLSAIYIMQAGYIKRKKSVKTLKRKHSYS